MKREITRPKKAIPLFKRKGLEWQSVKLSQATATICRTLSDPIRATIFELLDEGPVRQIDLTRLVNEATGRRYDVASIMHHLDFLKRAGLIAYKEFRGGKTKVKMIYRVADVEVRVRKRPRPEILIGTIRRGLGEWLRGLKEK